VQREPAAHRFGHGLLIRFAFAGWSNPLKHLAPMLDLDNARPVS